MPPAYGVTPAGFACKPVSQILADAQAQIWATTDPQLDLSAQSADGQILGIECAQAGAAWELLQVCWNQFNREDTEGAGLDNVGDLTGTPREGASYTQVYCTLTLDPAHAPYTAGALVANVEDQVGQTYSNASVITAAQITPNVAVIGCTDNSGLVEVQTAAPMSGVVTGDTVTVTGVVGTVEANETAQVTVIDSTHFTLDGSTFVNAYVSGGVVTYGDTAVALFQSTVIGETPAVNDNTLNTVTTAVTGWSAVNNPGPGSQSQAGTDSELDPQYMVRQVQELAASGSCNPSATAEALLLFASELEPPLNPSVQVLENDQWYFQVVNGIGLPPHSYAVVLYDSTGTLTPAQVGQVIYNNKPAGIVPTGSISVVVQDPVLGPQVVYYSVPQPLALYVTLQVTLRSGVNPTSAATAIRAALVAAAVAPTPANGEPLPGQLAPGSNVYGSQLEAVVMGVPGVLDVPSLAFAFTSFPSNTAPLTVTANEIATLAESTIGTHVVITFT